MPTGWKTPPEKKFRVLSRLLNGEPTKKVAFEEKLSLCKTYRIRREFPLFFRKNSRKNLDDNNEE